MMFRFSQEALSTAHTLPHTGVQGVWINTSNPIMCATTAVQLHHCVPCLCRESVPWVLRYVKRMCAAFKRNTSILDHKAAKQANCLDNPLRSFNLG